MAESNDPLGTFEHVVVLMLENRSFDNLLGYLYPSELPDGGRFEGLEGKERFNPIPDDAPPPQTPTDGDTKTEIRAKQRFTDYHSPFPDPGETYPHVNRQLWDKSLQPPRPLTTPTMTGFVNDYVQNYPAAADKGPKGKPAYPQYRAIMDSYPPERVSVLSELAKGFAVFDNWHCSVPSQTWCNRAFWHAATSYGQVINGPSLKWLCGSNAPNLFTRLVARFGDPSSRKHPAERSAWRIYSPAWNFVSLTAFLHLRALIHYADQEHIRDLEGFFEDCAKGALPRYSFLEPQFLFQHNDQHPSSIKGLVDGPTHAGSVVLGEQLIWRIYDAVRRSDSKTGNNAQNTLLIITHDEHGGCFDHVPPGKAVPPSGKAKPGQDGFAFDRLGVRVPMVMVSAHIRPGTILSETLDHTSFLSTMAEKWQLEPLTDRDRAAAPFTAVFNAADPRPASDWPTPAEPTLPAEWQADEGFQREGLHDMQRGLLRAAALIHGLSRKTIDRFETLGEAHQTMQDLISARQGRRSGLWRILGALLLK